MDDPFFWIKGFTKWMTSDTTKVLFAQGKPQVNYAVTLTGEETVAEWNHKRHKLPGES